MSDPKFWMIALQVGGHALTIGALLLANARAGARQEERVRGLSRALDTHQKNNAADHERFYSHIVNPGGGK